MAFSFSRKLARIAISSSRALRASLDFFAALLFRFLRSKYLSSFCSSGIGFFSLRGRFWFCCTAARALASVGFDPESGTENRNNLIVYTFIAKTEIQDIAYKSPLYLAQINMFLRCYCGEYSEKTHPSKLLTTNLELICERQQC